MNKVMLVGRLARDPEMRTGQTGMVTTRFTIAVNRNFVDRNGERGADFISCVAFNKLAENVGKFCKKGMLVSVEGNIRTGSYDAQDGTKRYTTEIYCNVVDFLSRPDSMQNSIPVSNNTPSIPSESQEIPATNLEEDPFKSFGDEITFTSDDLPF